MRIFEDAASEEAQSEVSLFGVRDLVLMLQMIANRKISPEKTKPNAFQ